MGSNFLSRAFVSCLTSILATISDELHFHLGRIFPQNINKPVRDYNLLKRFWFFRDSAKRRRAALGVGESIRWLRQRVRIRFAQVARREWVVEVDFVCAELNKQTSCRRWKCTAKTPPSSGKVMAIVFRARRDWRFEKGRERLALVAQRYWDGLELNSCRSDCGDCLLMNCTLSLDHWFF